MSEELQYLTTDEMLTMENQQLTLKLENVKLKTTQLEIENIKLQSQINTYKTELLKKQAEDKQRQALKIKENIENQKTTIKETNKQTASKYELEEAWGYNPETGQILKEN